MRDDRYNGPDGYEDRDERRGRRGWKFDRREQQDAYDRRERREPDGYTPPPERYSERAFHPEDEWRRGYTNRGYDFDGNYDRSTREEYLGRANIYGSSGAYNYPGSTDYGLRGGADYSRHPNYERPGANRQQSDQGEGIWDSAKRFFGKGPKGWKRSDTRIWEDACEALARHPAIDAGDMEVEVKDGIVTLKGNVDTRFTKRRAEDVVEEVSGVEDVRNELQIRKTMDTTGLANVPVAMPEAPRKKEKGKSDRRKIQ
jgi:hypothetical protein